MKTRMLAALTLGILFSLGVSHAGAAGGKRAAPVYGKGLLKNRPGLVPTAGRISTRSIRKAAFSCMRQHLAKSRHLGAWTVAGWNRIDPKSVSLKRVEITDRRTNSLGYRLRSDETAFRAVFEVIQGRPGQQKPIKLYLESEMNLAKKLPRFRFRTASPGQGKVRNLAFGVEDRITTSWID
jgi:hypothetical protein